MNSAGPRRCDAWPRPTQPRCCSPGPPGAGAAGGPVVETEGWWRHQSQSASRSYQNGRASTAPAAGAATAAARGAGGAGGVGATCLLGLRGAGVRLHPGARRRRIHNLAQQSEQGWNGRSIPGQQGPVGLAVCTEQEPCVRRGRYVVPELGCGWQPLLTARGRTVPSRTA